MGCDVMVLHLLIPVTLLLPLLLPQKPFRYMCDYRDRLLKVAREDGDWRAAGEKSASEEREGEMVAGFQAAAGALVEGAEGGGEGEEEGG